MTKDILLDSKICNQQDKNILVTVFESLPSNQKDVPSEFYGLNLTNFEIEVESKPSNCQIISGSEITRNLLSDLDSLKNTLGGAPNYDGEIVTLNNEDANKFFLGQPLSAVKDWLRMTLIQEWRPISFWRVLASWFNVTDKITQYEQAHEYIQRFGIILANKEEIYAILDSEDSNRYIEFNKMTGLAWHPKDNGPGMEKFYINMLHDFMTIYYLDAKKRGVDALITYYRAYQGVCFEDRMKKIEEYMALHPTLEMQNQAKNNSFDEINPSEVALYTSTTDIETVIYAVCGELSARLTKRNGIQTLATPQELYEQLVTKELIGRAFPDPNGSGKKIKITVDYLNSDEVRTNLIDIIMVLADGPIIVEAKNSENCPETEDDNHLRFC